MPTAALSGSIKQTTLKVRFENLFPVPYHPCSFTASDAFLLAMPPGKITFFDRPKQAPAKVDK